MKRTDAEALIKAIVTLREGVSDQIASSSVVIYPTLKNNNKLISAGTRINYKGQLFRASVDLWDVELNDPENAPSLWEAVNYKDGIRVIPEIITAGLAFAKNEKGWWNGEVYISLIDANVYTPEAYPAGWEKVI